MLAANLNESAWSKTLEENKSLDADEINRDSVLRGTATSLWLAIGMAIIGAVLNAFGDVDPFRSSVLISLILGNVIGFVADSAFASHEGRTTYQDKGVGGALSFGLSSLTSASFSRYLVTVLIDVFISSIFIKGLKEFLDNSEVSRCDGWLRTLTPAIATSIISAITFYAYTNSTRFDWAIKTNAFPNTLKEFVEHPAVVEAITVGDTDVKNALQDIWDRTCANTSNDSSDLDFQTPDGTTYYYKNDPKCWDKIKSEQDEACVTPYDILNYLRQEKACRPLVSKLIGYDSSFMTTNLLAIGSVAAALYLNTDMPGTTLGMRLLMTGSYFGIVSGMFYQDALYAPNALHKNQDDKAGQGLGVLAVIALVCTGATLISTDGAKQARVGTRTKVVVFLMMMLTIVMPILTAWKTNSFGSTVGVGCTLVTLLIVVLVGRTYFATRTATRQGSSLIPKT